MSVVNTTTGEIVAGRPEVPLQVITPADVRASIRRAKASLEKAAEEIVWQIEREAWVTLGYSSWTAMREAEYGDAAFMVPGKQRPELVARMRSAGESPESIAKTAGVSRRTVFGDFKSESAVSHFQNHPPPPITNSRGQERPSRYESGTNTGPTPASADPEPITTTCPTCNGTGKVTR